MRASIEQRMLSSRARSTTSSIEQRMLSSRARSTPSAASRPRTWLAGTLGVSLSPDELVRISRFGTSELHTS